MTTKEKYTQISKLNNNLKIKSRYLLFLRSEFYHTPDDLISKDGTIIIRAVDYYTVLWSYVQFL